MNLLTDRLDQEEKTVADCLAALRRIFDAMDAQYDRVARKYGFECKGCKDNCCLTRFYHHTVLEYAYLKTGLNELNAEHRDHIIEKAVVVNHAHGIADRRPKPEEPVRIMCPLNTNGMCGLYAYRPMICRLHGIPHEISPPMGGKKFGPGCGVFDEQCGGLAYNPFDRTPFYGQMAKLEQQLRQALGYTQKIKMTIAEILVS